MAGYKITAHFEADLRTEKAKLYRCEVEIEGDRLSVPEQYYAVVQPAGDIQILRKPIGDNREFLSAGLRHLEELANLSSGEIQEATKAAIAAAAV